MLSKNKYVCLEIRFMQIILHMKQIKFYPSDRSKIKIDGKIYKGYTIDSIPEECNSWFNYRGLTFVVN